MWNLIFKVVLLLFTSQQKTLGLGGTGTNTTNSTKIIKAKIKSLAGEFDLELADESVPLRRPRTPVYGDRERALTSLTIVPDETLCIHQYYVEFFKLALATNRSNYEVLMTTTITFNDEEFYYFDPEDLCIEIDDELIIDIYKYDCSNADVCVCGLYMGYVDPDLVNVNPNAEHVQNDEKKYYQVSGLDRKLKEEEGTCVSGLKGHCTMTDQPEFSSGVTTPLYCHSMYECVIDDSYGPILRNKETDQTYGVCVDKAFSVSPEDNLISYQFLNQASLNGPGSTVLGLMMMAHFIYSVVF